MKINKKEQILKNYNDPYIFSNSIGLKKGKYCSMAMKNQNLKKEYRYRYLNITKNWTLKFQTNGDIVYVYSFEDFDVSRSV